MPTIQTIPTGLTGNQLIAAINSVINQIQGILNSPSPEAANLDMGQYRIINLGDPVGSQDGVNLRTLKSMIPSPTSATAASKTVTTTQIVTASPGYTDLTISTNVVTPDLSVASCFRLTLNQATRVTVQNPIWTGGALAAGLAIALYVEQDSVGQRPSPAFGTSFGNDVKALQIAPDANNQSVFLLRLHPEGSNLIWHVDGFVTRQFL